MEGEGEPFQTPYNLGLARSPPPIDSGAIDEALSSLKFHETKEKGTVEIVVEYISERKVGRDGEREEARDGDNDKKEVEEGEEGIDFENEKKESEEKSDGDNEKKEIEEEREEGRDGDSEKKEDEEREERSDCDSEKKKSEEKENGRNENSEKKEREERSDCDSKKKEIEEMEEVRDGDSGKKEIGEREEERDGDSEDKEGEEREKGRDDDSEKKEGEKRSKVRVIVPMPYPQKPWRQDCPTYLRTGYCSFGSVCYFNHPLKKSSKVSENRDCKGRERDGGQEKKEWRERGKMKNSPPYPQREGKEDCLFYLKAGHCTFGANCCFNHPLKNADQVYILF